MNAIQEQGCKSFLKLLATHYNFSIVTGATPATDRTTVYLPDLKDLDPAEVNGYSFHEFLHLAHTDFKAVNRRHSDFVRAVGNALEDTRIEMLGTQEYPGAQIVLNGRINALLDKGQQWWSNPDRSKVGSFIATYVCLHGKVHFLASPARLAAYLAEGRNLLVSMLGKDVVSRIDSLLMQGTGKLESTPEAYALARRLEKLIKQEAANPSHCNSPDESGDEDAEHPDDDETSSGRTSSDGSGEKDAEHSEDEGSSDGRAASDESAEEDAPTGEAASADRTASQQANLNAALCPNAETRNFLENSINGETPQRSSPVSRWDSLKDKWVAGGELPVQPDGFAASGKGYLSFCVPLAERLRCRLNGMLQTQTHQGVYLSTSGRRISQSSLGRLAAGNLRVMERRSVPRQGLDTTVHILLDCSGSMQDDGKFPAARDAALALLLAMRKIPDCTAGLSVFPHWYSNCLAREIVAAGKGPITKQETCFVGTLDPCGATSLDHGLAIALSSLECRSEHRKIVILITDGEFSELSEFKERALRDGIDIYVLGLGVKQTASIESVGTAHAVLTDKDLRSGELNTNITKAIAHFAQMGMFRAK